MWVAARVGAALHKRMIAPDQDLREDFGVILAATLTLLGLIIGFSFSMATSRYDLRKNYEEAEANAIGTEFVRADLLPSADAAKVRELLREYLDQRIQFYTASDERSLEQIGERTSQLRAELWSAVRGTAATQPTPIVALAVSGMNDVLNSQGYTQKKSSSHCANESAPIRHRAEARRFAGVAADPGSPDSRRSVK
jgi:hypothetical protein